MSALCRIAAVAVCVQLSAAATFAAATVATVATVHPVTHPTVPTVPVIVHPVIVPEDSPLWDCSTMGNRVCGPNRDGAV